MQVLKSSLNKIVILSLVSSVLFSYACNENKATEDNTSNTSMESGMTTQEMPASTDTPSTQILPVNQTLDPTTVIQQSNPSISTPPSSSGALNPPHGEPGHDCAIAVGAPLNSAKGTQDIKMNTQPSSPATSSPIITPATAPAPVIAAPAPSSPGQTAPGMNPPHGEPGHDCAKPVGAPLK